MNQYETIALGAAIAAIVTFAVTTVLNDKATNKVSDDTGNGTQPPPPTHIGTVYNGSQNFRATFMKPQAAVWNGPGNNGANATQNGQIYVDKFLPSGNPNLGPGRAPTAYERGSFAIQDSTKNPFANGTNGDYAYAADNSSQDPQQQASPLAWGNPAS